VVNLYFMDWLLDCRHFGSCLLMFAFLHLSVNASNTPPAFTESWESISNRLAAVPLRDVGQKALGGDATAQFYIGVIYADGTRVQQNYKEGFRWLSLAAQQGMAQAQYRVGRMYANGQGVRTNYADASRFYLKAAEQGDAKAQNNLGWLYLCGTGVKEDVPGAIKWFEKSAEQGEKRAAANLAWTYARGVYGPGDTLGKQGNEAEISSGGVVPNHELAEKWMRQAVDLNTPEGQFTFAELLYAEMGDDGTQDKSRLPEAGVWYRKAAEQGQAKAQFMLAELYNYGELGENQRTNCIPWYFKAAAQGNAEAQAKIIELPKLYPNDEQVRSLNQREYLVKAEKQDNLEATFELARRYYIGEGVRADPVKAFLCLEKVAQNDSSGFTDGYYYLAVMYEKGFGVEKDLSKARPLYQWSAQLRLKPESLMRVGLMYENGEGVLKNTTAAATNYFRALQFGYADSRDSTLALNAAFEHLLNLWVQGQGLPTDKSDVAQLLDKIQKTPVITSRSQFLLGEVYYQGKLVPKDLVQAAARFRIAANHGYAGAREKVEQAEAELTPSDRDMAASVSRFNDAVQTNSLEGWTVSLPTQLIR
jgi:TPR repeat protein